jgi:hypothetical protein
MKPLSAIIRIGIMFCIIVGLGIERSCLKDKMPTDKQIVVDKKWMIRDLQVYLNSLGNERYDCGVPDNVAGEKFRKATTNFMNDQFASEYDYYYGDKK